MLDNVLNNILDNVLNSLQAWAKIFKNNQNKILEDLDMEPGWSNGLRDPCLN